jgi:hypothetical protein
MTCFLTRLLGLIIGIEVISLPFVCFYIVAINTPPDLSNINAQVQVNTVVSGTGVMSGIIFYGLIIGMIICLYYWFKPCMIEVKNE